MVETQQLIWSSVLNRWEEQLISTLNLSPILDQSLYVSKTGSDDFGNGSSNNPFLTISYALSKINNANSNNRYAINVFPGEYSESFNIKPWTAVVGITGGNGVSPNGSMLVEISAAADTCDFDVSWGTAGFSTGWIIGLGFKNHQTFNESTYSGTNPQLNFYGCSFNSGISFLGTGTLGTDNIMLDDCLIYGGTTVKGWQYLWTRNSQFLGGTLSIDAGPLGSSEDTTWLSQNSNIGTATSPTNVILQQDGYGLHFARAYVSGTSVVGNLLLSGELTSYNATVDGIPCSVMLLNSAENPTLMTCATSLAYMPANNGYWAAMPTSVSDALDQLAAKESLSSAPPSNPSTSNYSSFFAMMPGDNSATVAVGSAVQFPQNGPTSGNILRLGPSIFELPAVATYEITFQVSISEPGQLQLALNGTGLPHTVVGRATGTNQLFGNILITTTSVNSILSVINPVGNSTALTITPIAGGASPVSSTLTIRQM